MGQGVYLVCVVVVHACECGNQVDISVTDSDVADSCCDYQCIARMPFVM